MYGYNNGYGYNGWGMPNTYAQPTPASVPDNAQFNRYTNNTTQPNNSPTPKSPTQFAWVNGEVGAQAYFIDAGNSALLMDSDNPRFYIKSADLTGKATIKAYKYEEFVAQATQSTSEYVTKKEFDDFKNALLSKLNVEDKI